MRNTTSYLWLFAVGLLLTACANTPAPEKPVYATTLPEPPPTHTAQTIEKSSLRSMEDTTAAEPNEQLDSLLVGRWSSTETVTVNTFVFDEQHQYVMYDGLEEMAGTWRISDNALFLETMRFDFELIDENQILVIGGIHYTRDKDTSSPSDSTTETTE